MQRLVLDQGRSVVVCAVADGTEHGDAVMAMEGDQLVVAAMNAHPTHHKLQQLGCSILASLATNRDGSLPLPIVPRVMSDMPHRTHRQYVETQCQPKLRLLWLLRHCV